MKSYKDKKKSQLLTLGIIIVALMGILMINSGSVTADSEEVVKKVETTAETSAVSTTATTATSTDDAISNYSSKVMPSMLKIGGALIVVIICIYAGLFLLKKTMGKKYSNNRTNNVLEIIESTHIAPKKTVTLIRVAGKSVLVGTTENNMSVLTELDETATEDILAQIEVESNQDNFKDIISVASEKIKSFTGAAKQSATAKA